MTDDHDTRISRREFLSRVAPPAALAACAGAGAWFFHNRRLVPSVEDAVKVGSFAVDGQEGRMVVVHGSDGARAVAAALAELGGVGAFVKAGDRVLVKPNCAFDRPPHLGATTSPEVVAEVVRQCRGTGAEVRVMDNPINDPEGCFVKSGLRRATEGAGGEVWLPQPGMFRQVKVGPLRLREWQVLHAPLAWATKVIGVPTVKSHNLCWASLSMKNWYGLLGEGRNRMHQAIHEVIADLGFFLRPTLVVLDGTRLLKRNGPTGGSPADVEPGNVIVAGTDQVALDAFGVELLGLPLDLVEYLAAAEQLGVGTRDRTKLGMYKEIRV